MGCVWSRMERVGVGVCVCVWLGACARVSAAELAREEGKGRSEGEVKLMG
jgi:hypothetical protein